MSAVTPQYAVFTQQPQQYAVLTQQPQFAGSHVTINFIQPQQVPVQPQQVPVQPQQVPVQPQQVPVQPQQVPVYRIPQLGPQFERWFQREFLLQMKGFLETISHTFNPYEENTFFRKVEEVEREVRAHQSQAYNYTPSNEVRNRSLNQVFDTMFKAKDADAMKDDFQTFLSR